MYESVARMMLSKTDMSAVRARCVGRLRNSGRSRSVDLVLFHSILSDEYHGNFFAKKDGRPARSRTVGKRAAAHPSTVMA